MVSSGLIFSRLFIAVYMNCGDLHNGFVRPEINVSIKW